MSVIWDPGRYCSAGEYKGFVAGGYDVPIKKNPGRISEIFGPIIFRHRLL